MFHLSNLLYIDGHCILFVMIYIESPLTKVLYKYILIDCCRCFISCSQLLVELGKLQGCKLLVLRLHSPPVSDRRSHYSGETG